MSALVHMRGTPAHTLGSYGFLLYISLEQTSSIDKLSWHC